MKREIILKIKAVVNYVFVGILLITVLLLPTACRSGSSSSETEVSRENAAENWDVEEEDAVQDVASANEASGAESGGMDIENEESDYEGGEAVSTDGLDSGGQELQEDGQRKLIRTVEINAQTKKFDETQKALLEKIVANNGYIEISDINGRKEEGNRSAYFCLRIPSQQLDTFLADLEKKVTVTYFHSGVEDVTLNYVDIESRLKALRMEQESLFSMLESAEKLKDILQLQSRLTEVRYEIEAYESKLRALKNQVDYSTVSLYLDEVQRVVATTEGSFTEKIKTQFSDSLYGIQESAKAMIIWIAGNSPYLVLFLIALGIVLLTGKRTWKLFWSKTHKIHTDTNVDRGTDQPKQESLKMEEEIQTENSGVDKDHTNQEK